MQCGTASAASERPLRAEGMSFMFRQAACRNSPQRGRRPGRRTANCRGLADVSAGGARHTARQQSRHGAGTEEVALLEA